jgi:WD40 repeat protein
MNKKLIWLFFPIIFLLILSKSFAANPSLGVKVDDLTPDYANFLNLGTNEGVYVSGVLNNSPASKAGLKVGDVILEVNGKKAKSPQEFINLIKMHNVNEGLQLLITRGDKRFIVKIIMADAGAISKVETVKPQNFSFVPSIVDIDSSSFEKEVLNSSKPVLVYFYAKWCPPCRNFVPLINEIANQYADRFKVVACDVQKNEGAAKSYGIGGIIPSIILFNNGMEFEKILRVSSKEQIDSLFLKFSNLNEKNAEVFAGLGKEQGIKTVSFIDKTDFFITQNYAGTINIWDYKKGRLVKSYFSPLSSISPDRHYVAFENTDRTSVKIENVFTEESKTINVGHFVHAIAVSSSGRFLASFGMEKGSISTFKIWDVGSEKLVNTTQISYDSFSIVQPQIAFSPDNRYLAFSIVGETSLFDTIKWQKVASFTHKNEGFREFGFLQNSRYIFAHGLNLHLFDLERLTDVPIAIDYPAIGFVPDMSAYFKEKRDNSFELYDIKTKDRIMNFQGHIGPATTAEISADKRYILSGSYDGTARLWDVKSGKEIAQFVGFLGGEWVVITPEGYYNSSLNGHKFLNVRIGQKVYTIEQFYDVFYRPDIVSAKLNDEDISGLITLTIGEAIKNPPPAVEIASMPKDTSQPKVKVCYKVKSTGGGIGEVRLFHNGKLVHSDGFYKDIAKSSSPTQLTALSGKAIYAEMRGIKITAKGEPSPIESKSKGEEYEDCREIDAVPGENEVSVAAFNSQNTVQSYMKTASFNANLKREEPHLYILSIGIDQYKDNTVNLKYAVKDSKDIKEKILKQAETIYKPQNIHYELLTDSNATKVNIINKITDFSKTIKPTDSFILFAAGHGILLQNQYYMLTHEYDGKITDNNLISSNEIVDMSKKIKSLSQLFIFDTCHAGGVDYIVSGLYDARMSVLAKKMGLHIYASANDKQSALDGYQGNGLFTYTLLDGLNNKREADKNQDKQISLTELGEYSKTLTIEISKKIGHTQTPFIINFGKDSAVYNLR